MTKRNLVLLLCLFVFFLTGCSPQPSPSSSVSPILPSSTLPPSPLPSPTPTLDPLQAQLAAMTTEQKVGQLLVAGIEGTQASSDAMVAIQGYQVGGIILFGRNVESAAQLSDLTNALKGLNGNYIPLFLCVDEEGGRVSRMPPEISDVPPPLQFGQSDSPSLCSRLGRMLGDECAAFGLNVDFAPSLDIWSNPENTVIGDRAFGTDSATVSTAGNAAWEGITDRGIIPVIKHFPGHGDTAVDSHVGLPVVEKNLSQLKAQELVPFSSAIQRQVPAIMVAHILEKSIDETYPASLSPKVVTGLLRNEMGFDGIVFTDDLTMGAIADSYGIGDAAVLAVEAGCDMLLVCHQEKNLALAYQALLQAVQTGRISIERLDQSVTRVLSLKEEFELTNKGVLAPDVETLNAQVRALLALLNG